MQIAGLVIALNFIFMIVISPSIAHEEFDLQNCPIGFEDEIDESDSNALAAYVEYDAAGTVSKLVDILYYLIYGNEDEPVPKSYKCARNSPVDPNSGWTTTRPKVSFGHIFCGQICSGKAEGFHSLTTSSNYGVCAKVNPPGCNWFNDGNGKCAPGIVEIWDDTTKKWVPKLDVSSMFSSTKTLATIINILVKIYNECQPPAGSTTLCALGCRYQGNFNSFDIKLVLRPQGILSAFPLPAGECTDTPRCSPNCQNI